MGEATASSKSAPRRPGHRFRGYVYIGASAVFWGISASLGRAAFTGRLLPSSGIERISPLILSQARTGFSFAVVAIVLLVLRGPRRLRMPWRDLVKVLALGLGGIAVSNYFYYLAIERTNIPLRSGFCSICWRGESRSPRCRRWFRSCLQLPGSPW